MDVDEVRCSLVTEESRLAAIHGHTVAGTDNNFITDNDLLKRVFYFFAAALEALSRERVSKELQLLCPSQSDCASRASDLRS